MAFEPINIFSHRIDPRGVVALLRQTGFAIEVDGPDDDWSEIRLTVKKGGLLRKPQLMTFGHNSEYYDGPGWPRQVMGMQGYFSNFDDGPLKGDVLRLIRTFRFALAVPQHDLDIDSDDQRLALLYAVCKHLDGAIFTPSALRDAQGRVLLDAAGESDPEAVLPQMPEMADYAPDDDESADDSDQEEVEPEPPTPDRVARRALALTAVAARATLELNAPELEKPEELRSRLLRWVGQLETGEEFEPEEWKVLQRPVGRIEQQDKINAMWRIEGLAVLAWALGQFELPADDELVSPDELYEAMGFLDVDAGREIMESPELRPADELDEMQKHLLMLHWRLRDYSLRPEPMDFVAFSKKSWIGEFDISRFKIVDRDLAIGGVAIHDADEQELSRVQSLAMERHKAINWLMGYSETYSDTDTST